MAGNSTGTLFRLTTFGESHGPAIGGIIDGCPAGIPIDTGLIQLWMSRRRPSGDIASTTRKETDAVEILSGILDGITLGTPIGFIIRNNDVISDDYDHLKDTYRPSHADFTYEMKYGRRDHRGSGRASARETACRVAAGAIAVQILAKSGIHITAWVKAIGNISIPADVVTDEAVVYNDHLRMPDAGASSKATALIEKTKESGDTLGGVISCCITGLPAGLGEPVFDKFHADLAKAMMSINAVKGFEIGSGFDAATATGSNHNDAFIAEKEKISTATNRSGGVQGGITNGAPVTCNIAFKPVATLMQSQQSVDKGGNPVKIEGKGRHDVCVVPRAVPIVQAMAALVVADHLLRNRAAQI